MYNPNTNQQQMSEMDTNEAIIGSNDMDLENALVVIDQLHDELMYYRSLLLTDLNPTNASVLNALRMAVDIREEFEELRESQSLSTLYKLCGSLEKENIELKRILSKK